MNDIPSVRVVRSKPRRFLFVVNAVLVMLWSASASSSTGYRRQLNALKSQLLSNYSGEFAPYSGAGEGVHVELMYIMMFIMNVDDAQQTLTTQSYIVANWTDPDLRWNTTEQGSPGEGVSFIMFRSEDIWTPKLLVSNKVDGEQVITKYDRTTVFHDGTCTASIQLLMSTVCLMDVTRYPFDTQTCGVTFSPVYGDQLILTGSTMHLPVLDASGQWEMESVGLTVVNGSDGSRFDKFLHFQLKLRRKPVFYVFTVLVPMMIMSVTGACGFLLPIQCGEKVSFQVSIMVSLSIFLSFVNDSMPKTSTSISRLAVYVDLLLLQSGLSLLATLLTLRRHYHGAKRGQGDGGDREQGEELEKKGKKNGTVAMTEVLSATDQNATRESTGPFAEENNSDRQTAPCTGTRRFWICYCCFCRMPPEYLDVFFFVVFLTAALSAPGLLFI